MTEVLTSAQMRATPECQSRAVFDAATLIELEDQ
jgi:hypothetical protein